jgi:thymidylate kinase
MELRNIMLNAKYEPEMTVAARELVSQAIRSIHLEKVVAPALTEYDIVVQDRGLLSGLAYGTACGNDIGFLMDLICPITANAGFRRSVDIYDNVILLTGNVKTGLDKAISAKQEFEAGDAIEMKGLSFMEQVNSNMSKYSSWFKTTSINIDGKSIEDVFSDITDALNIRS